MKHDPRRVIEIILDELTQALGLSPEAVDRCRQQIGEWLRPQWPVLFLATGDEPPSEAAIESFRALTALGIEATLIRSHSFAQVWPTAALRARLGAVSLFDEVGAEKIAGLPERFPVLCVLTLSSNTVVKTLLGLSDALPPRVLRAFLERGRPVVAAGLPPPRVALDEGATIFWGLPLAVRQWLVEGYRTLEQWGVEFVEDERLTETVRRKILGPATPGGSAARATNGEPSPGASSQRTFVTADDVRAARARGERQIRVARHAIVTDEARESARRWGILLLE